MHAALASDIFTKDQHAWIGRKLVFQSAAHGGHQVDARTMRLGTLGARCRHYTCATQAALLLQFDRTIGAGLGEYMALDALRIGSSATLDLGEDLCDERAGLQYLIIPVGGG